MLLLKKTHDRTMFAFLIAVMTAVFRKTALFFAIMESSRRIIGVEATAVLALAYFPFYLWASSYNRFNHPDERI